MKLKVRTRVESNYPTIQNHPRKYFVLHSVLLILSAIFCSVLLTSVAPWRAIQINVICSIIVVTGMAFWLMRGYFRLLSIFISLIFLILNIVAYQINFSINHEKNYPDLNITNMNSQNRVQPILEVEYLEVENIEKLIRQGNFEDLLIENADRLLENKFKFYKYQEHHFTGKIDWSADPYSDPSWNWNLHNMGYIAVLIKAYKKSDNLEYLIKAEQIVLAWISDNSAYYITPPSVNSWNDHSTSFRLLNWIYFFEIWKKTKLFNIQKSQKIMRSMQGHAERLAQEEFYTVNHNHGIDQDRALLTFATAYPFFREADKWSKIATDRVIKQFEFSISENGVHLEHSPEYHLYGMEQLSQMIVIFETAGIADNILDKLKIKLEKMKSFVPMILKPDGNIVQVGDSGTHSLIGFDDLLKALKYSPRTLLSDTNGNSLVQKYICDGYGSIRNFSEDRADFEKSFYLFFNAGAHKDRGHRQSDDLSFVVSNMGHEVLVDPGFYSYRDDPGRDYVKSVHAHNTLSINGNNYNNYKTKFNYVIENYEKGYVVFSGSHENFEEAEHKRWIIWINDNLLVVIDHLVPYENSDDEEKPINYVDQYFHFAPELKIELNDRIENGTIMLKSKNDKSIAQISQLMEKGIKIFHEKGNRNPMQGWHSNEHAKLTPAPTLITRFDGKEPLFTTILFPTSSEFNNPTVELEKTDSIYSLNIKSLNKNIVFQFDTNQNDLIDASLRQICES